MLHQDRRLPHQPLAVVIGQARYRESPERVPPESALGPAFRRPPAFRRGTVQRPRPRPPEPRGLLLRPGEELPQLLRESVVEQPPLDEDRAVARGGSDADEFDVVVLADRRRARLADAGGQTVGERRRDARGADVDGLVGGVVRPGDGGGAE